VRILMTRRTATPATADGKRPWLAL
jgi:hypothetical protein